MIAMRLFSGSELGFCRLGRRRPFSCNAVVLMLQCSFSFVTAYLLVKKDVSTVLVRLPLDEPRLSLGRSQASCLFYTVEAHFVPGTIAVCPWDKLGSERGRKSLCVKSQKRKISQERKYWGGFPCRHPAKSFSQAILNPGNKHFGMDMLSRRPQTEKLRAAFSFPKEFVCLVRSLEMFMDCLVKEVVLLTVGVSKKQKTLSVSTKGADDRQITHLICVRLRHLLYDFLGCVLGRLCKKTTGRRPKTPPKKSETFLGGHGLDE